MMQNIIHPVTSDTCTSVSSQQQFIKSNTQKKSPLNKFRIHRPKPIRAKAPLCTTLLGLGKRSFQQINDESNQSVFQPYKRHMPIYHNNDDKTKPTKNTFCTHPSLVAFLKELEPQTIPTYDFTLVICPEISLVTCPKLTRYLLVNNGQVQLWAVSVPVIATALGFPRSSRKRVLRYRDRNPKGPQVPVFQRKLYTFTGRSCNQNSNLILSDSLFLILLYNIVTPISRFHPETRKNAAKAMFDEMMIRGFFPEFKLQKLP